MHFVIILSNTYLLSNVLVTHHTEQLKERVKAVIIQDYCVVKEIKLLFDFKEVVIHIITSLHIIPNHKVQNVEPLTLYHTLRVAQHVPVTVNRLVCVVVEPVAVNSIDVITTMVCLAVNVTMAIIRSLPIEKNVLLVYGIVTGVVICEKMVKVISLLASKMVVH